MPPLHCTATAPSLRAMHLSPGLAAGHCAGLHYSSSVPFRSAFLFQPQTVAFWGGHPHRQSTLSGYRSGGFVLAWPMMVSAGRCPCRLVRRGSEHDHDPAWASGLVACSLFESQSDPRSAQTNLQRGVCVWSGLFCRVDGWCNDMSVVGDWRDRLCGRLVGGGETGVANSFAGGDEAPSGVPANESADLFIHRWVF